MPHFMEVQNQYDFSFPCNTKAIGWGMVILVHNMVIVLLAALYTYFIQTYRHI